MKIVCELCVEERCDGIFLPWWVTGNAYVVTSDSDVLS